MKYDCVQKKDVCSKKDVNMIVFKKKGSSPHKSQTSKPNPYNIAAMQQCYCS